MQLYKYQHCYSNGCNAIVIFRTSNKIKKKKKYVIFKFYKISFNESKTNFFLTELIIGKILK